MMVRKLLKILYPVLILLIPIDVFFWEDMDYRLALATMSALTLTIAAILVLEFVNWKNKRN